MTKADFAARNAALKEAGEKEAANPRNLAAGSLRLLDPKEAATRKLRLFAYTTGHVEGLTLKTQTQTLEVLKEFGFHVTPDDSVGLRNVGVEVWSPSGQLVVKSGAQPGMFNNLSATGINQEAGRYYVKLFNYDPTPPVDYAVVLLTAAAVVSLLQRLWLPGAGLVAAAGAAVLAVGALAPETTGTVLAGSAARNWSPPYREREVHTFPPLRLPILRVRDDERSAHAQAARDVAAIGVRRDGAGRSRFHVRDGDGGGGGAHFAKSHLGVEFKVVVKGE
jgi:hypothetical protein